MDSQSSWRRHAFASRMIDRGISSTVLARLMGHESTAITERRYIHLFDKQRTDRLTARGEALRAPVSALSGWAQRWPTRLDHVRLRTQVQRSVHRVRGRPRRSRSRCHWPATSAGPNERAGFIDAPVTPPPNSESSATVPPIAIAAAAPTARVSVATAMITNIRNAGHHGLVDERRTQSRRSARSRRARRVFPARRREEQARRRPHRRAARGRTRLPRGAGSDGSR